MNECMQMSLFRDLSFCWDCFEQDGMNEKFISHFATTLISPVLVVGSGQGLVSRVLLDKGHRVHSIDCVKSMAQLASQRNSIDTEVINFLDMDIKVKYNSIVINTGVIYPSFIHKYAKVFVNKINDVLNYEGVLLLSFFRKTDFDNTIWDLNLHRDRNLIVDIWMGLNSGQNIFDVLSIRLMKVYGIKYLLHLHSHQLEEFENQIRDAGRKYAISHSKNETEAFISKSLLYVSFGLKRAEQKELFHLLDKLSFNLNDIHTDTNTSFATLTKKIVNCHTNDGYFAKTEG